MESVHSGIRTELTAEQQIVGLRAEVAKLKASLASSRDPQYLITRDPSLRAESKTIPTSYQQVDFSRHELHEFFMQAPIAICVLDGPDHVFTLSNPLYDQLAKRDVLGKKVREAFTDAEVGPFFDLLDRVFQTGEPFIGKEASVPLIGTEGQVRERFIDLQYHPLRNEQGQVTSILAVHIDVTEQVQARKQIELSARALAAEKATLLAILNQVPGAVTIFDGPEHVFSLASDTYLSLFFGGRQDLIGKSVREAVPEAVEQGFVALLDRVYQEGEPICGTETAIDLKQLDGTMKSFYISFAYHPLRVAGEGIKGVVAVVVNVSEQVQIKQALKKLNQDLRDERDLRENFVAALSHDLRNPLTAAKISAQLLFRSASDPLMFQKLSGRIVENMDRIEQMIRDLLDVTRIRAGEKIQLNLSEWDLSELVEGTMDELASVHGDRFVLKVRDKIRVYWDYSSMKRVIENLITNAVKYGSPVTPITIKIEAKDSSVEILVHNEGSPISPDDQKMLFVQFRRSESAKASGQKGWGIGLTLVRSFIEAHGGSVNAKSSEGEGTSFFMTVPQDSRSTKTPD
ncbi:MAG: PAS domain-containing protein [Bdellovibrionales bacterium]|nr:PAS domain-containing protein [Oligoflexia bacterium]